MICGDGSKSKRLFPLMQKISPELLVSQPSLDIDQVSSRQIEVSIRNAIRPLLCPSCRFLDIKSSFHIYLILSSAPVASWPWVLVQFYRHYPQNTHYSAVAYPAAEPATLAAVEEKN